MLPSRIFFDDMLDDFKMDERMKCDIYEKDNVYYGVGGGTCCGPFNEPITKRCNGVKPVLLLNENGLSSFNASISLLLTALK